MRQILTLGFVAIALTLASADALGHIKLLSPPPRDAGLKFGPCGTANSTRGNIITTFKPGEKIIVSWEETIAHPGHYRISFDDNGNNSFVDPASFNDFYTAPSVLVDNIPDPAGKSMFTQEVTLPDIECQNCTLQVMQIMTDKAPYGDGNDLYYQCADLVLVNPGTGGASASSSSSSSASSSSGAGGAGAGGGAGGNGGTSPSAGPGMGPDLPIGEAGCSASGGSDPSSPSSQGLLGVIALAGLLGIRRARRVR